MGTSQVLDHGHDAELDFHAVSQITAVGALADEVVGDLIRVGAGMLKGGESEALLNALEIFKYAATMQREPSLGLWDSNRLPDALRLLADSFSMRQAFLPKDDARVWITSLADDLEAVVNDEAEPEVLAQLERTFSSISIATLGATSESLHQRGYASTWLTS